MQIYRWIIALSMVGFSALSASAQGAPYFAGQTAAGQDVTIDLSSINRASATSVDFVYYLGSDRIYSQANCATGTWTTFPEGAVHDPQSAATAEMLRVVCSSAVQPDQQGSSQSQYVFAPPSNVRSAPNGDIQCVVSTPQSINIYGFSGEWGITDFCGKTGYIHRSQLQ
ncbi:MAG: hypothetical protein HY785_24135 [Oscillatoriophycideae cyanobacterium NC_groundwater_1537_Pr4_S-0.65um_50_18]|nr:hypothetical protein [Oscillatoriophycideae cyanobacterium NC_groundwater_1537_Pr4_S-0.65um_50_18]